MSTRRILALTALAVALAAAPAQAKPAFQRAADIGAWCWFGDPRAVEYRSETVLGWVADDGSVMVGDTSGARFNLHARLQRDDHNNPSFHVRRDGRLMAFWSAHAGDRIYYRTARKGITRWGPARIAPANPPGAVDQHTYPAPMRVGGKLHLFWSGVNSTATHATSRDEGRTWSPARAVFQTDRFPVRYIKYAVDGDAIHMAWTIVHPRWVKSGVYHAVLRRGRIYRQDGTQIGSIGRPIEPTAGDLVYTPATAGGAWIHDLEIVRGVPAVVYATFPTVADHTYRVARLIGGRWRDRHVTMAGPSFNPDPVNPEEHYSGGIVIDPSNGALYLSRLVSGQFEIQRWERRRGRWRRRAITSASRQPNVRPYAVGDHVAWMRGPYASYTRFGTSMVLMRRAR